MAYIDKIYGTKKQYHEFKQWCRKNVPSALRYFYTWEWDDRKKHPICSFSSQMDWIVLQNCPIPFVIKRIVEQYGLKKKLSLR